MKQILVFMALICGAFLLLRGCDKHYEAMERYEIEHNCKYDYNELCYTKEQKPWLFK